MSKVFRVPVLATLEVDLYTTNDSPTSEEVADAVDFFLTWPREGGIRVPEGGGVLEVGDYTDISDSDPDPATVFKMPQGVSIPKPDLTKRLGPLDTKKK